MKPVKEGKVREIYDNGDSLIMVATDRISCFDVILHNTVTKKGTVLTQMSKFWFDYTKDILPNHMISTDVKDMPEFFQTPEYEGKSMMCRKLNMLPLECIVRGYITGSGWKSYIVDEAGNGHHAGAVHNGLGRFGGGLSLDGDDLPVLDADISAENDLHPWIHGHGCDIGNEGVQIGTLPFV